MGIIEFRPITSTTTHLQYSSVCVRLVNDVHVHVCGCVCIHGIPNRVASHNSNIIVFAIQCIFESKQAHTHAFINDPSIYHATTGAAVTHWRYMEPSALCLFGQHNEWPSHTMNDYVHTYIHTYIHTYYIYKYICTHTRTHTYLVLVKWVVIGYTIPAMKSWQIKITFIFCYT